MESTKSDTDLAIETIELLLQRKYDEAENRLVYAQVLQLLKFCLRTYFPFDRTIYEQVKGTPMCSPISGFIAEAILQRLESLVFQHQGPKYWVRCVDDIVVVIDRDQLLAFKEHLNAVFPAIQSAIEEEKNNQLALSGFPLLRRIINLPAGIMLNAPNMNQRRCPCCVPTIKRRPSITCSPPPRRPTPEPKISVYSPTTCCRNCCASCNGCKCCQQKDDDLYFLGETELFASRSLIKYLKETLGRSDSECDNAPLQYRLCPVNKRELEDGTNPNIKTKHHFHVRDHDAKHKSDVVLQTCRGQYLRVLAPNDCAHGCQYYICTIYEAEEPENEPPCVVCDDDSSDSSSSEEEEVYLACKCQPPRPCSSRAESLSRRGSSRCRRKSRQRAFRIRTPSRMRIVLSDDSC
ncbi:hypothetical protein SprV_0301129300 [Sparganum proliferum]